MKRIVFFVLVFVFVAWSAWAFAEVGNDVDTEATPSTDNSTTDSSTDNSVNYRIDLGNGDGALLIVGDGNQVYLPPKAEDTGDKIQPNEVTYSEDRGSFMVVLTETDIYVEGTRTRFSKMVLELRADGWDLVWFEQE